MSLVLQYFSIISTFSFFFPLTTGLIKYRKCDKSLRIIIGLMIVVLLVETIGGILSYKGINTYPIIRLYTIVEFLFMLTFYKVFFNSAVFNKIYIVLIVFFILIAFVDVLFVNNLRKSDTLAAPIESFILIIIALSAFYSIMKNAPYENLLATSFFWINTAYLIYFAGTLFVFAFLNVILKNFPGQYSQVYMINTILNPVSYILIAIGLWKAQKA